MFRIMLAATLASVAIVACSGAGASSNNDSSGRRESVAVEVKTFQFQPDPIEVAPGTTVTWTNRDNILHTVTSGSARQADGSVDERLDGPGSTARVTFEDAGRYEYFCSRHTGMRGVVVVE